jgi:hypothetical protein
MVAARDMQMDEKGADPSFDLREYHESLMQTKLQEMLNAMSEDSVQRSLRSRMDTHSQVFHLPLLGVFVELAEGGC